MKIIDLHCDTISKIYEKRKQGLITNLRKNNFDVDLIKMVNSNYLVQCFAIFVKYPQKNIFKTTLEMINLYQQEIKNNSDLIEFAYSYEQIKENYNNSKMSAILTIEEGNVIENNINNISILAKLGVKIMTLTWNVYNEIGYPNNVFENRIENNNITDFGKKVILELNRNNIIIDVSHLNDQGIKDVLKISTKPIIASHSNCRSVCNHVRNLPDYLILEIKEKKGLIGINYYPNFVSKENNSIDELIKHLLHLKQINCLDIVSLGSDFDGIEKHLKELQNCNDLKNLVDKLKEYKFTLDEIENICYKNSLKFFAKNLIYNN